MAELLTRQHLRFWLMIVGALLALLFFEEIVDDVFYDPLEGDVEVHSFDRSIAQALSGLRSPMRTQMMTDLTALGSASVIAVLFVVFASLLASFRDIKGLVFITIVLLGATTWPLLLKTYFARGRPAEADWLVHVSNLSFPSGHAFGAAAAYVGFAYYASRYARSWPQELFFYILGGVLALLVGVSRIYLGVHYPTDVLAGLSAGVAWGLGASAVYELMVGAERRFASPLS